MNEIVANYRTNKTGDGYLIRQTDAGRFFWEWLEDDFGPDSSTGDFGTIQQALRAAADDWEDNGSPEPRYAAVLRAAATRLDKKEADES